MKRLISALAIMAATMSHVNARCFEGDGGGGQGGRCTIDGKPGRFECAGGVVICDPSDEDTTRPTHGTVDPKYYVLTVVYAPPGTQGGGSASVVEYGSGSTTGTTTSISSSFNAGWSISSETTGGVLLASTTVGASFEFKGGSGDSESLEIKKSATSTIRAPGEAVDGIDHDGDQIWLWLNPKIDLAARPLSATWTLTGTNRADIQFVYVGGLKNPSTIPPGVMERLQLYGITAQDFPDILKRDSFASGSPILDPTRYHPLNTTFPYEPPRLPNNPQTTLTFEQSNSTDSTQSLSKEEEYTVGLSFEGEVGRIIKTKLKTSNTWTWKSSSSTSTSAGALEKASVTIGGPSFGYRGPTDMEAFYDALYKSFVFRPVEGRLITLGGTLSSSDGKPLAGKEISVVAGGIKYRTFTNAEGRYRFFGNMIGPAKVRVDRTTWTFPNVQPSETFDIRLPRPLPQPLPQPQ
jgi:hypothetical protein